MKNDDSGSEKGMIRSLDVEHAKLGFGRNKQEEG